MATIRLIPSTYKLSNTSYLQMSNAANMYANVDSTTYATVKHNRSRTTSYYVYIRGFNFSSIPSEAIITGATVKVKARVQSASTSYRPTLYNNTSAISGVSTFSSTIGTTSTGVTSTVSITATQLNTFKGYGNNFGIRLQINRSNKNTVSYLYIYGAEIEVTYTLPVYYTITSSISGSGVTINPLGETSVLEGGSYSLSITPTDSRSTIVLQDNGVNKSSSVSGNIYSLTNITSDHTIVVSVIEPTQSIYIKINGVQTVGKKVYKKINNTWVEQTDYSSIFDLNTNYKYQ